MDRAKSVRYGGEIVYAKDCNYDAYLHLGLICEECENSVFLRAAHKRTAPKSKEEVTVPQTFAHFKAVDAAIALRCENRIARSSRKDLEKKATAARNQRLKLIHRWFWSVFWTQAELEQNFEFLKDVDTFTRELPSVAAQLCSQPLIRSLIATLRQKPQTERQEFCSVTIDEFARNGNTLPNLKPGGRVQQRIQFLSRADQQLQTLISTEVLNFLLSSTSKALLEQVLTVFYLRATDAKVGQVPDLRKNLLTQLIMEICWTDWAGEFEKLERNKAKSAKQ